MKDILWWESLKEGEKYLFSFLYIDRVKSTDDPKYYPQKEVAKRAALFRRIAEEKFLSYNGKYTEWHGDGTVCFFYAEEPGSLAERAGLLSKRGVDCARGIFSELVVHEELKAYMAIHVGLLSFEKSLGKIHAPELNVGGHVQKVCPEAGILVHEDAYRVLSEDYQKEFRYFGTTARDKAAVFVYPRQREISEKNRSQFIPASEDTHDSREKFLDFIKVRYGKLIPRGLRQERLISLDLLDIFAPLKARASGERAWQGIENAMRERIEKDTSVSSAEIALPIIQRAGRMNRLALQIEHAVPPITIPELLERKRHTVLLGPPGAGKSTLVSWLAVCCAQGKISVQDRLGLEEDLLPVPVSVGHLAHIWAGSNKNIGALEALIQYFNVLCQDVSAFLKKELEGGRALVLLDGMDEIQEDLDRGEVARWLESFIQSYSSNRFVVTSRIIGFPGLSLPQGDLYRIEDLTIQEARPLVEKWMVAIERKERGDNETAERMGKEQARKLADLLESTPRLSSFIANPFLLTLTVLIHRVEARLPNYRIQLFERMVQTLMETWHQARGIGVIQPEKQRMDFRAEAIPILAPLALWMHEQYPSGTAPEGELKDFIVAKLTEREASPQEAERSANEFLEKLKKGSGLLEPKGRGVWGFTHLSFEEYLCAVELVRDEKYDVYLDKYRYHARWEEVLVLVASELGITQTSAKRVSRYIEKIWKGTGHDIHEKLLHRHVFLAGRCLANTANVDRPLADEILDRLMEFLLSRNRALQARAGAIIRDMWSMPGVEEKAKEVLLPKFRDKNFSVLGEGVSILNHLGIQPDWAMEVVEEAIREALKDKDGWIRREAINAIGSLQMKSDLAMKAIQMGLIDDDRFVRCSAIQALTSLEGTSNRVLEVIKEGLKDKEGWVRAGAIDAIASLKLTFDWATEGISEALKDKDGWLRSQAIRAIGSLRIESGWSLDAIWEGFKDKDKWVRYEAILSIVSLEIKSDWAIEAIREGFKDEDEWVRSQAIQALGFLGIKSDWAKEAIRQSLKDESQRVRDSAIWDIDILKIKSNWAMDAVLEGMKESHNAGTYKALWSLSQEF